MQEVIKIHKSIYGSKSVEPYIYSFAPGRVNFIGEHVDYMGGGVVPAAAHFGSHIAITCEPAKDWLFSFSSMLIKRGEVLNLTLNEKRYVKEDKFRNLCYGTVFQTWKYSQASTRNLKPLHVRVAIEGKVPLGSGLSSSTSICVSLFSALMQIFKPEDAEKMLQEWARPMETPEFMRLKKEFVKAIWRIEVEHCNLHGGTMDMYTALFGKPNIVLKIDCAKQTHELVIMPDPKSAHYSVLLVNSMRSHNLGADYNKIHRNMENAQKKASDYLQSIGKAPGGKPVQLKDLAGKKIESLEAPLWLELLYHKKILEEGEYKCSSYAVAEMERVEKFVDLTKDPALKAAPIEMLKQMGELLNATHLGMAWKLCVSTEEIEKIYELCNKLPGVYGARVMGGGFGGCVIAIVDTEKFTSEVREQLRNGFRDAFPDLGCCDVHDVIIGRGAFVKRIDNTSQL